MTITSTTHNMIKGQPFSLNSLTPDEYNGNFTVASWVDANNITATFAGSATSPATGTAYLVNPLRGADQGYFTWLNYKLRNKFNLLWNAGIGGNTTTAMLARISRDVLAYSPKYCFVWGGINDITADTAVATTKANLDSIYQTLRSHGITVIALTVLPLASGHASFSAARTEVILNLNNWIRQYGRTHDGFMVLDAFAAVVSPLATDGTPTANMLGTDNIHPSPKGAKAIADYGYTLLNSLLPTNDTLISSAADDYGTSSSNSNICDNGVMDGTGGAISGTVTPGATSVATGWTIVETGSGSIVATNAVARSDVIGYDQQMDVTSVANGDVASLQLTSSVHGRVSAGDTIYFECDCSVTSITALKRILITLQLAIDGVTYYSQAIQQSDLTFITDNLAGVWRTPNITIPSDAASITQVLPFMQFVFSGAGGATVKVGRCQIRKV